MRNAGEPEQVSQLLAGHSLVHFYNCVFSPSFAREMDIVRFFFLFLKKLWKLLAHGYWPEGLLFAGKMLKQLLR